MQNAANSQNINLERSKRGRKGVPRRRPEEYRQAGDPCFDFWYGITCDERGRVISIDLADNRLRGEVPPVLEELVSLQRLDLSNNQISRLGPFGICCAVRVLRLAGNRIGTLTGIDDIARTLTELDVSRNQLRTVHDIQPLSGCSRLTTVRLDGNPLLHDVPRTVKSRAYPATCLKTTEGTENVCASLSGKQASLFDFGSCRSAE